MISHRELVLKNSLKEQITLIDYYDDKKEYSKYYDLNYRLTKATTKLIMLVAISYYDILEWV